jgi:hypothetical protein
MARKYSERKFESPIYIKMKSSDLKGCCGYISKYRCNLKKDFHTVIVWNGTVKVEVDVIESDFEVIGSKIAIKAK